MPEAARDYCQKQLADRKTWSVKRQTFRDGHTRVTDTLSPKEHTSAILLGDTKALNRADECWTIEHVGGFAAALAGYVDAQTGRLEFLWLISGGQDGLLHCAARSPVPLLVRHAPQNLAFPVELVHGPAADGPAALLDRVRPAVLVDVAQALLFGRFEAAARGPGVAPPSRDRLVVHDRH